MKTIYQVNVKGKIEIAKDIPKEAKKMFCNPEINWVEEGVCCDLSTVRGYHWNPETNKLTQKTGSSWNFIPFVIYIREPKWRIKKLFKTIKETEKAMSRG